ncbi:hypothetical protein [Stenotrophomonas sp. 278]|uniref:hypothetical protein n=1 Tax=Stenotrophomonas sp. 278 TaxID=2479851 RepID=UPI000F674963|nr:hypothetical protein [Stenotrophomonas sp. 278]RRU23618.1 hypothetical protein EGJ34_02955 [Stenotrophomonas sp. 278]
MTDIHALRLYDTSSAREKDEQRQKLAADVAEFRRNGGHVQVLGNDPINKKSTSRRQIVEGGIDGRSTPRKKKA